ncbi:RND family efflux transporter MFP subunit [Roseimicrobium gellanilyticum]|uniref:RND family efflux transporter MFP subunit n=1 Tax=Roseimicrobium gellanilyticum TaxID=748857 RepID=A0A366HJN3_9BACT|nr:efflux RND transporter periplasmic adaptor subunit [Roseimicrobium gellanilyticum]RBP42454.1 RND family efflux transporter MFP subunit [Roseimicrobium gellanilyticum]
MKLEKKIFASLLALLCLLAVPCTLSAREGAPGKAHSHGDKKTSKEEAPAKDKEEGEHKRAEGEEHDHDHEEAEKADPNRATNTVVLDEQGVKNLNIETAETEEGDFEETIFALGRIEILPGKKAIVSSRIPGRAFSVLALPDQEVDQDEELMWVESRQPGDPPPTVMLGAPIAGTIAKVNIAQGQPIEPNDSLIEIVNLETVEAAAYVPEHLAGKLKKGQKARIKIAGYPDKVFEAELAHIGAYADEESATIEAAFHVANPDKVLRPGMRAEFAIVVSARENVLSIPKEAVQGDATGRFVFIKDYDLKNAFVKTPVDFGVSNDQSIEVISGLFAGDEVVTKGAYTLTYAGKGSVSLKEALDAAHGHPHNEDGTEMTAAQIAAAKKGAGGGDHDHDHSQWTMVAIFFAATTGLLLALLVVSMFLKRPSASA